MGSSTTNSFGYVFKYMDQKGLATMLTNIELAGITPEVNLRNPLCTSEKACKQGIRHGFESQDRYHKNSKTGTSLAKQKNCLFDDDRLFIRLRPFDLCAHTLPMERTRTGQFSCPLVFILFFLFPF